MPFFTIAQNYCLIFGLLLQGTLKIGQSGHTASDAKCFSVKKWMQDCTEWKYQISEQQW